MKKLLLLSFTLLALPSFATMLQPHGHSMCLNALESQCKAGTQLYYAKQGCACLRPDQFFAPNVCKRALITCENGTEFSVLQQLDAQANKDYAGCGCFSVNRGMIPQGS